VTDAQRLPFDHDQVVPEPEAQAPDNRLESDEDAELRRLHMLRGFGMVAGTVTSRYDALRGRDRRHKVREPDESKLAVPMEKTLWDEPIAPSVLPDPQEAAAEADEAPELPTERVISDTREIFGQLPETRRGLGIFRR
jgi:hypothetical protein